MEVVQEFQKYEKLVHDNQELIDMEKKLKVLQKKIVNQKAKQDETVSETIQKYQILKEQFETHPLVVNYLYLQEEVNGLLQMVNDSINAQLSK